MHFHTGRTTVTHHGQQIQLNCLPAKRMALHRAGSQDAGRPLLSKCGFACKMTFPRSLVVNAVEHAVMKRTCCVSTGKPTEQYTRQYTVMNAQGNAGIQETRRLTGQWTRWAKHQAIQGTA
eukprot:1083181-Pelagomonas_calceolata.AAC.1